MKKLIFLALFFGGTLLTAQNDVLSKYTYIPGDKIIFSEDLSGTAIGEIPESFEANGDAETVAIADEKWLRLSEGTELTANLKAKTEDMTIEFYVKSRTEGNHISFELMNEELELSNTINVYNDGASWNGSYKGEGLPSNSITKDLFKPDQKSLVCVMIQKGRTKVFVNQIQVMNVTNFTPVMPNRIKFRVSLGGEKDFFAFNGLKVAHSISSVSQKLNAGKYIAYGIYFDTGSDKIRQDSYATLRQIGEALKANASMKVQIVGHTDNTGTNKAKVKKLSLMRSESVKQYLIENFGIDANRLTAVGKGGESPIADNGTANGRALNRRVEFITK